MSSARIIRCYEYERLKVGREIDGHTFTADDLNGLQRIHESQSLYFDLVHNGVQFKNYVGVLHMQRLTIEILPKADNHPSDEAEIKQAWSSLVDRNAANQWLEQGRVCGQGASAAPQQFPLGTLLAPFLSMNAKKYCASDW